MPNVAHEKAIEYLCRTMGYECKRTKQLVRQEVIRDMKEWGGDDEGYFDEIYGRLDIRLIPDGAKIESASPLCELLGFDRILRILEVTDTCGLDSKIKRYSDLFWYWDAACHPSFVVDEYHVTTGLLATYWCVDLHYAKSRGFLFPIERTLVDISHLREELTFGRA